MSFQGMGNLPGMSHLDAALAPQAQGAAQAEVKAPSLPLGVVGAAGGALVAALIYGAVGRFVGEISYLAVLVGIASGMAATTLGKGNSIPLGVAAGVLTLFSMVVGKLIVGAPPGVSWIAYHTTLFDIIFCWALAPLAAVGLGGVPKVAEIFQSLRGRFGV
jgi:hypothetical protein